MNNNSDPLARGVFFGLILSLGLWSVGIMVALAFWFGLDWLLSVTVR